MVPIAVGALVPECSKPVLVTQQGWGFPSLGHDSNYMFHLRHLIQLLPGEVLALRSTVEAYKGTGPQKMLTVKSLIKIITWQD